jgi:IS605 OrfB family transposase
MPILNYTYAMKATAPQHRHLNHQRWQCQQQYNIAVTMARKLMGALRRADLPYVLKTLLTGFKNDNHPKRLASLAAFREKHPECPSDSKMAADYKRLCDLLSNVHTISSKHLDTNILIEELLPILRSDLDMLIPFFKEYKSYLAAVKDAKRNGDDPPPLPKEPKQKAKLYYWLRRCCLGWVEDYCKAEIDKRLPTGSPGNGASRSTARFAVGGSKNSRINRATHPTPEQKANGNRGIPVRKPFYKYTSINYQESRATEQVLRKVKKGWQINVPCLPGGMRWVPIIMHRSLPPSAKIKHVLLRWEEAEDRWYAVLSLQVSDEDFMLPSPDGNVVVGIDPGQKTALTMAALDLETGEEFCGEIHWNHAKDAAGKKAYLQRKISRMQGKDRRKGQRGSIRWKKTLKKVKKLDRKVANQRKDTLHKVSRSLVDNYTQIGIGDYTPPKRKGNKKGNRGIVGARKKARDISLSALRLKVAEKAERAGVYYESVDEKYTTQECNVCHNRTKFGLNVREWDCGHCGTHHLRDRNSAINIRNKMLMAQRGE